MLSIEENIPETNEKTVEIACHKHGLQQAKSFYFANRWTEAQCPECQKEAVVAADIEAAKFEAKQREAERERKIEKLLSSSGIPKRYRNASLDDSTNAKKAQRFVDDFQSVLNTGRSIALCGGYGTGKTHIACWIVENAIKRYTIEALFTDAMDIIRRVKETYSDKSTLTERSVLNSFIEPDLLVIDEIGVQFGSEAEKIILFEIFNKRYAEVKPTMLISNLDTNGLKKYIGESIVDRFRDGGGGMWVFEGESMRGIKQ